MTKYSKEQAIKLFWSRVDKTSSENGCWLWTAYIDPHGYGRTGFLGSIKQSHRVAWELLIGSIPEGLILRHRCNGFPNTACVNPNHLLLGTKKDNVHDALEDGTHARGENSGVSVLTDKIVTLARKDAHRGIGTKEIADKLGVTQSTLHSAVSGRTWKHIDDIVPPYKNTKDRCKRGHPWPENLVPVFRKGKLAHHMCKSCDLLRRKKYLLSQ